MNAREVKRIGILQTGILGEPLTQKHGEFPQMFQDMLGQDTFEYITYPVTQGTLPKSPTECDGWILTGSKHGAYEDHDWIPPLEEFIRILVANGNPTVGICFGHQIMAQAMGGKVEKYPDGWSVGLQEYTNLESGETIRLRAFHQDQVVEKPKMATVTHSSDFCQFAGLQYSPACFSLQPHPEHTADFTEDLILFRRNKVLSEEVADAALAVGHLPNDHEEVGKFIEEFLSQ